MQRKPRKDKVLLDITVDIKMTGVLDVLAKCEVAGKPIVHFIFSYPAHASWAKLQVLLEKNVPLIWTMPSYQARDFIKAVSKLKPEHVIVQYYT